MTPNKSGVISLYSTSSGTQLFARATPPSNVNTLNMTSVRAVPHRILLIYGAEYRGPKE